MPACSSAWRSGRGLQPFQSRLAGSGGRSGIKPGVRVCGSARLPPMCCVDAWPGESTMHLSGHIRRRTAESPLAGIRAGIALGNRSRNFALWFLCILHSLRLRLRTPLLCGARPGTAECGLTDHGVSCVLLIAPRWRSDVAMDPPLTTWRVLILWFAARASM